MMITCVLDSGSQIIPFSNDKWDLSRAEVVRHLGREALKGMAVLQVEDFDNGTIEFDLALTGQRSYPGIAFRIQGVGNYENFYFRPHHNGLYSDVLQYTPVFNGVTGWQLYSGEGFTAAADLPLNRWFHVRLEITAGNLRVYLDDQEKPALIVPSLKRSGVKGGIALMGPQNGSAFFSRFAMTRSVEDFTVSEIEPTAKQTTLMDWELSRPISAQALKIDESRFDLRKFRYPGFTAIFRAGWQGVKAEASGLVDVARHVNRNRQISEAVYARTFIQSESKRTVELQFGYSDEISIFLNGHKLYYGNSAYKSRDPSFAGIIGFHDSVFLTLEKGCNELFIILKEKFGGWGFMCRTDSKLDAPVKTNGRVEEAWQTDAVLATPESVVYNPHQKLLYVSSYDINTNFAAKGEAEYTGFISQMTAGGDIVNLKWCDRLFGPAGMAIHKGILFVAERKFLTEIDLKDGAVIKRHEIPGSGFPNDVVVDEQGAVYVSDTVPYPRCKIFRFKDNAFTVWKQDDEVDRSNGLFLKKDQLFIGNSGDGSLKAIDLGGRKPLAEKIITLGAGVIDGIRSDRSGHFFLSQWRGKLFEYDLKTGLSEILDLGKDGLNIADFELLEKERVIVIPTFYGNRVVAYRLVD